MYQGSAIVRHTAYGSERNLRDLPVGRCQFQLICRNRDGPTDYALHRMDWIGSVPRFLMVEMRICGTVNTYD